MLKDNESEISKDIMNIIENNKNFDEIIENKVDALDKKQNYVYEELTKTINSTKQQIENSLGIKLKAVQSNE